MNLSSFQSYYEKHVGLKKIEQLLRQKELSRISCRGLLGSSAPLLFSALWERFRGERVMLFVLDDEEQAGYFYNDLTQIRGEKGVYFFPSSFRRAVKYGQKDAANEVLRTAALNALGAGEAVCVVSYPAALAEKVVSKETVGKLTLLFSAGESYDLTCIEQQLLERGFKRRDYVYEPGEFAVRGSILDIYSYGSEYPVRLDFFGDELETMRVFEVQTQLSKESLKEFSVIPDIENAAGSLLPFTHYLQASALVVAHDFCYLFDSISQIYKTGFSRQALSEGNADVPFDESESNSASASQAGSFALKKESVLLDGETFREALSAFHWIETSAGAVSFPDCQVKFHTEPQPVYHKNFDLVKQSFLHYAKQGYVVYITADNTKQHERLEAIFDSLDKDLKFVPLHPALHGGFVDKDLKICCFTDHQIFDRFHKYNVKTEHIRDAKVTLTLKEIMQFSIGDYIVHLDHGIGRFAGLVRVRGADGAQQEMIKLLYKNDDVVLVSIHSLHKLSKYKGREGLPPSLSKLGSGAWETIKEKTKKKIKDIARDLIILYSRRKEEKGFAFSKDTFLQKELEAGFLYEDTPDQLKVTQEVKADMERIRPMDRLVCGDVGFGKTEIAVRAAMKAAADNKQVAVLVPTTVLALQHYKTFERRLKGFPVKVDYISRARTSAQTKQVLKDLAEGKTNIVIGTHKLIGKQVKFKDLGLLIIDEEQKFGVSVKEKLRQIKVNVDTLTMSATPIPRTLQFSLMGARDFSVIQTPPPNRRPIQTELHVFGHEIIAEAINFEMSRNGQVFIVTHRVSSLYRLQELAHKYVPDARIAVGHGQMPPAELEKIIIDFVNHDYDVLISTTIVENGIDIPNANTIIIDSAHHFGLSDLHQMRGRVGRSDKKAFCYLLAPPLSALPADARRRLQAIEEFSDLGSGIHIAMQDLDIRGAGNLLGAEQSGFIADLGYEAYQKILSQAVSELKNEEFSTIYAEEIKENRLTGENFVNECNVECDLHAFFPESYVPGAAERVLLYRELDNLSEDEELEAFRQRMIDRFGELPMEGEELLRIVKLRRLGRRAGVERLSLKLGRMILYFVMREDTLFYDSPVFGNILNYGMTHLKRCEFKESKGQRRLIIRQVSSVAEACDLLVELIHAEH